MTRNINLPFAHYSEFPDPINTGITHYTFTVKTTALERGFPLSVNPREQKITGIYKKVKESLETNDGLFFQKNMGITILARSAGIDSHKKIAKINCGGDTSDLKDKAEIYGVINGGHTYKIIVDSNENSGIDTSQQFVRINVITGIKDKIRIQEIARAHNTAKNVSEMSLADFMDEFDWMKKSLGDSSKQINWHENDSNSGTINVMDTICLLHCLHPELYPEDDHNKQPTIAYNQKAKALEIYLKDYAENQTFQKFKTILPDILELRDFINANAWEEYKKVNKGLAKRIFEPPNSKFAYINLLDVEKPKYIPFRAALLPVLASCRVLVKKGATYSWKLSDFEKVKEFCRKSLAESMVAILNDIGDLNPTAWGKDFSLWSLLYLRAGNHYHQIKS